MNAEQRNHSDTRSPWTDAFRAGPGSWSPAEGPVQAAPSPEAPHPAPTPSRFDPEADAWTSEALFDLYNL